MRWAAKPASQLQAPGPEPEATRLAGKDSGRSPTTSDPGPLTFAFHGLPRLFPSFLLGPRAYSLSISNRPALWSQVILTPACDHVPPFLEATRECPPPAPTRASSLGPSTGLAGLRTCPAPAVPALPFPLPQNTRTDPFLSSPLIEHLLISPQDSSPRGSMAQWVKHGLEQGNRLAT